MTTRHVLASFILLWPCIRGFAEISLQSEGYSSPALLGYLGNPAIGMPGTIATSEVAWLPGDFFLRSVLLDSNDSQVSTVCRWQVDPVRQEVLLKSMYNVGGVFAASPDGRLLCAQSRRGDENPQEPEFSASQAGTLGCFQLADGRRLWSLQQQPEETLIDIEFSMDGHLVLVLGVSSRQMNLRLLEAASGKELKRHDFEGPEDLKSPAKLLTLSQDDLWMIRPGTSSLLRIPLTTLLPEDVAVKDVPIPSEMQVGGNGRWFAFYTMSELVILERKAGRWQRIFEDYAPMDEAGFVPEGFDAVAFTPDNQHAVVVQRTGCRLMDLPSGKVVSSVPGDFYGACLAPDGRRLLKHSSSGHDLLDLPRLTPRSTTGRYQQQQAAQSLLFLDGGRSLASVDANGVWLWEVTSRRPYAFLQSAAVSLRRKGDAITSLAFVPGDNSIVAVDGTNFIKWRLPALPSSPLERPLVVMSTPAFGALSSAAQDRPDRYAVFASSSPALVTLQGGGRDVVLRQGLGARAARTFPGAGPWMRPRSAQLAADGKSLLIIDSGRDEIIHLDLVSGVRTAQSSQIKVNLVELDEHGVALKGSKNQVVRACRLLPLSQRALCETRDGYCVAPLDGKTDVRGLKALPEALRMVSDTSVISPDEKWMVAFCQNRRKQQLLAVWNLDTGELHGLWKAPPGRTTALAFAPDGKLLACAHGHNAISLWQVDRLTVESATQPQEKRAQPDAAVQLDNFRDLPRSSNNRTENPLGSGVWRFEEDGVAAKKPHFPEAGRLRVNGEAFKSQAAYLMPSLLLDQVFAAQMDYTAAPRNVRPSNDLFLLPDDADSRIASGCISECEGRAADIWINRQIGNPVGHTASFLTFTDTLTNMGEENTRAAIDFEVQFPAGDGRLMDSSYKIVETGAGDELTPDPDAIWIAPVMRKDSAGPVPVCVFRSPSSGRMPKLVWKAGESRLIIIHQVELPPGEPRHLVHGMRLVERPQGSPPLIFKDPEWMDFSQRVPFVVGCRGLNFDNTEEWRSGFAESPAANAIRRRAPQKDGFGFVWNQFRNGGFQGELGAAAVLQLWLDGAPLPFSGSHLFDCVKVDQVVGNEGIRSFTRVTGFNLQRTLRVDRHFPFAKAGTASLVMDKVQNLGANPESTSVTLWNTFNEPVKQVYAADGRPLEIENGPIIEDVGGALILEFGGDLRPATMVAFYEPGAALKPVVSWQSRKRLRIDHQLIVPPQKQAILWHATTQRPLASFSSVQEAFTGCLPFKRADTAKPQLGDSNLR